MRPNRELGQNFLIDSNILGVIERAADLGPEDVVLEIGGGLGVLSEHLAPLVAHTARFVAERRGVDYEELERIVDRNAAGLFGW